MNVGTEGHIDHGRKPSAAAVFAVMYGAHTKACSCLTKTHELEYHDPKCEYRQQQENWYEREIVEYKKKSGSETPTDLQ